MMRLLAAVTAFLLAALPAAGAERLRLPGLLVSAITTACPDCAARGVVACGDRDVVTGANYLGHAIRGEPALGYVLSWPMGGAEMRRLSETLPIEAVNAALAKAFAETTLIAFDGAGQARALPGPKVRASVPPALHACLADPAKPWGCCAAGCGEAECCEKSLGAHRITAAWRDAVTGEELHLRWSRNGSTTLTRINADGGKTTYFCLAWSPLRLD